MKGKIFIGPAKSGKSRVARMIMEHVGIEKTMLIDATKYKDKNIDTLKFLLGRRAPENVQLIVFDECKKDFPFEYFYPVDHTPYSDTINHFWLLSEKQGEAIKTIKVPQLIFITDSPLNQKLYSGASFKGRFDVIEFPLNEVIVPTT